MRKGEREFVFMITQERFLSAYGGGIDKDGKVILEPNKYNYISEFSEGLATVQIPNPVTYLYNYGYIDLYGKQVIHCMYDQTGAFSEGKAYVELNRKCNWIDKSGKELLPMGMQMCDSFNLEYAIEVLF